MNQASEQIAKQFVNAGLNKKNWGGILINVNVFGAKGDGVTDDTAAVQACINAAPDGATVVFESGATYLLRSLTSTKSLHFNFNGAKVIADPTTSGTNGSPVIWFKGQTGVSYNLTNCTQNAITVTLASVLDAANFTAGDYVVIGDNRVVPAWNAGQPTPPAIGSGYADRSEITMISAIAGAVITLDKPIEWDYDTTPVIQKVTPIVNPKITGVAHLTEIDPGSAYSGLLTGQCPHIFHFQYCIEPRVDYCLFERWQLHAVNFHYCIGAEVANCSARDAIRPSFGGHGYFMRFDHCLGGVARNNYTRKVRHTVDFTQSYDGSSEHNYALNPFGVAYFMHGLGEKRCSSSFDTVVGGNGITGWAMGNPSFNASYDFDIINPKFVGNTGSGAILCQCNSIGMRVISPDIQAGERAIYIHTGASQIQIMGGKIRTLGLGTALDSIVIRSTLAIGDAFGINPRDITIDGVEFYDRAVISIDNCDGMVSIHDCKFILDSNTMSAAIKVSGIAPRDLSIIGNKFLGVYQRALEIVSEPSRSYIISSNFTDGGHTVLPMSLIVSTRLRLFENHFVSGSYNWIGDILVAKTGGAVLFANNPDTFDDMNIKATSVLSKGLTVVNDVATNRQITFSTGLFSNPVPRWIIRANATSESGANAGSDLEIHARNDAGGLITSALTIERKTGIVNPGGTYIQPLKLNGHYLWADSTGKLRIKVGSLPASDSDGIVVGTQT